MVALFVALVYLVTGGPVYETVDDVNFGMLVGGFGLVDKPDYHIYFSHFLIGKMLAFLHGLSQKTPWYAIYIVTCQIISMTVILRILMSKCTGIWTIMPFAFVFLYFGCTRFVDYLQFTTTSALVGIAAGLLALAAFERPHLKQASALCLGGSLGLIAMAALIRAWSAIQMLGIVYLVLLVRCVQRKDWKRLKAALLAMTVSLATVVCLYVTNEQHYSQSAGWRDWTAMNKAWMVFRDFDTTHSKLTKSACRKIGWSAADVNIFKGWYVLDQKTFSVENLRELAKTPVSINSMVRRVGEPDAAVYLLLLSLVVVASLPSKLSGRSRAIFLAGALAISVVILLGARLPVRVYGPTLVAALTYLLWYAQPSTLRSLFKRPNFALACMWAIVLGLSVNLVSTYREDSTDRFIANRLLRKDLVALSPKKEDLYVKWLVSVPVNNLRPFNRYYDELINLRTLNISTAGRSPLVMERMKEFGITDLLAQLDKEHVYLVSQDRYNVLLDNYIVSKYKKKPIFEPLNEGRPTFTVYKVRYVNLKDFPGTDLSPLCPSPGSEDLSLFNDVSLSGLREQASGGSARTLRRNGQPTISYTPDKAIDLRKYSHFFIELGANEWLFERRAQVKITGADGKQTSLTSIYLLPDAKLHRYAIPLGEKNNMTLAKLEVVPVWAKLTSTPFRLGNLGFLRDSINDTAIASKEGGPRTK